MTAKKPTVDQLNDLIFAWKAAKSVKSNAIVIAQNGATIGVGAGQMNRLESSKIAASLAGDGARAALLASDAFFPFADGLEQRQNVASLLLYSPVDQSAMMK